MRITMTRKQTLLLPGLAAVSLLVAATITGCTADSDLSEQTLPFADACSALAKADAGQLPDDVEITSTEIIGGSADTAACSVHGTVKEFATSTIKWEVELPEPDVWNGKSITVGGGGLDGFIPTDQPRYDTSLLGPSGGSYVRMSSDAGHEPRGSFYPWGLDDDALVNHAYRANHLTLEVGTSLAETLYGEAPKQRYMIGHSNGGRSALVAAQRYPGDYDGIIAMSPAVSQQAAQANLTQTLQYIFSDPDHWLGEDDIALFAKGEAAACDELDGLKDGIIADVTGCEYRGDDLACASTATPDCLTAGQLGAIERIYSDIDGFELPDQLQPGYPRYAHGGSATSDWTRYFFGSAFEARDSFMFSAVSAAAQVVMDDPDATAMSIKDPRAFQREFARLSEQMDPTDYDLGKFKASGGKMLIWQAASDTCTSLFRTADYFAMLQDTMGEEAVGEFARFVTSPGTGHNLDGPGTPSLDLVGAMDLWVQNGERPDNLVASKFAGGYDASGTKLELQRPVCEWPKYARYDEGDPSEASSFSCVMPDGD